MSEATMSSAPVAHSKGPAQKPVAQPAGKPLPVRLILQLIALLVLVVLPLVAGGYWTFTLGLCFANAIAILSVSFLVRYGGEVSIGHGVFVAAGAYTVALMEKYLGVSVLAALPFAALAGGLLGIVFGMIEIFSGFMDGGMANTAALASGIGKALITTAAGLIVAIPAVFFHRYLLRRIDEIVVSMEQEAIKLVEVVQGDREVDFSEVGKA